MITVYVGTTLNEICPEQPYGNNVMVFPETYKSEKETRKLVRNFISRRLDVDVQIWTLREDALFEISDMICEGIVSNDAVSVIVLPEHKPAYYTKKGYLVLKNAKNLFIVGGI